MKHQGKSVTKPCWKIKWKKDTKIISKVAPGGSQMDLKISPKKVNKGAIIKSGSPGRPRTPKSSQKLTKMVPKIVPKIVKK